MAQYKMGSTNYFMGCTKNSPYSFPLFKAYTFFIINQYNIYSNHLNI